MSIWCDNTKNIWHSKLYDKRIALMKKGLKLNRFPHPQSKLATQCRLGVITSQLHRYNIASTQPKDFLSAATSLYTAYIEKGYPAKSVNQYFEEFRRRHTPYLRPRKRATTTSREWYTWCCWYSYLVGPPCIAWETLAVNPD